ncbi:MAG: 6-phosphofructokinase [Gammaproteobacteria bacterium]|nr:6-phosphofructokinase [Gammaproteobacteria bacterium]
MKKIVVLTSGGDAPGMNAAIRAVVRTSCSEGIQVFGSRAGFQGIVAEQLIPLEPESVANCIQHGGTILKTDRCQAFYEKSTRDRCRAYLKSEKIDGLIVIGGNGTFQGAALLSQEGGPAVIGIPGTIDNDIPNTEYTIGFDTARNTALQAIDRIRDSASSHDRNFLVEVMGHHSGFLAVDVGVAGGAELIIIPEFPFSIEKMAEHINESRHKRQKLSSIIIVAEGHQPGRSIQIADQLATRTQNTYRVCILGHTQRGGSPTTLDRLLASQMGYMAVHALLNKHSHKMTAMQQGNLVLAPFPTHDQHTRTFSNYELLRINQALCV